MKKYLLFALLASLFAVAPAFSATCNSCGSCACECPPEPCCEFERPCAPDVCAFNAGAFNDIKCSWDLFATGSFIYWQASEGGLDPLAFTLSTDLDSNHVTVSDVVTTMDFDYKPGFKVGLGVFFCKDNWSLYAEYLWYHNTPGSAAVSTSDGIDNLSLFFARTGLGTIDAPITSSATWKLNLDRVDLQLGRHYFVGQCLTFNPHIGLRAAWISQTYTTKFNNPANMEQAVPGNTINFTASLDNWGIGAITGLDTNWTLCWGFRLFANTEASILYTKYTQIEGNGLNTSSSPEEEFFTNSSYSLSRSSLAPELGISLGLGWGNYLDCNNWYLDVAVSYDFNVLWNQNAFLRYNQGGTLQPFSYENLFLNGLTVTVKLEF